MPWVMISPQVLGKFADKETAVGHTLLFEKNSKTSDFAGQAAQKTAVCVFNFIMLQE
jgi:hypothetical protein